MRRLPHTAGAHYASAASAGWLCSSVVEGACSRRHIADSLGLRSKGWWNLFRRTLGERTKQWQVRAPQESQPSTARVGQTPSPKIRLRDAPSGAGRTKRRLGVSPASLFGLALAISLWALADLAASLHSAPPAETHTGAHVSFVGLVSSAPPHHGGRPLCCPVWSSPWRGPRSTVEVAQRITTSINPRGSQAFAGDRQASRSDTHTRLRGTAHG